MTIINQKILNKKLSIALIYCQHCVLKDVSMAEVKEQTDVILNAAMMPCSSKVQVSNLLGILDKEADGIEIIACPEKACQFLVGSCRAERRISRIQELLIDINVGKDRVGITRKMGLSKNDLIEIIKIREKKVLELIKQGDHK